MDRVLFLLKELHDFVLSLEWRSRVSYSVGPEADAAFPGFRLGGKKFGLEPKIEAAVDDGQPFFKQHVVEQAAVGEADVGQQPAVSIAFGLVQEQGDRLPLDMVNRPVQPRIVDRPQTAGGNPLPGEGQVASRCGFFGGIDADQPHLAVRFDLQGVGIVNPGYDAVQGWRRRSGRQSRRG